MNATPAPIPPAGQPPPEAQAGSFTVQLTVPISAPVAVPPPPMQPPLPSLLETAWPRSAQWTLVALLGLAAVLLGLQGLRSFRWGSRPTEREQGLGYRIDLNGASHAELLQLPGVGEKLAARIEKYREAHGGFRKVEELRKVPGVGPTRLECWRPWLSVGSQEPDEEEPLAAPLRQPPVKKQPGTTVPKNGKAGRLKGRINVNRASADELRQLPRIGPKLAQRIIAEREKRPFGSVDDLRRVPGIGPKTLEGLRPYVTMSGGVAEPERRE